MNFGISDFLRNSYAFLIRFSQIFFEWFLVFQYGRITVELKSMILPENEQKPLKWDQESKKELKDRTVEKEGSALTSLNR